jgi:hypothetical protein
LNKYILRKNVGKTFWTTLVCVCVSARAYRDRFFVAGCYGPENKNDSNHNCQH